MVDGRDIAEQVISNHKTLETVAAYSRFRGSPASSCNIFGSRSRASGKQGLWLGIGLTNPEKATTSSERVSFPVGARFCGPRAALTNAIEPISTLRLVFGWRQLQFLSQMPLGFEPYVFPLQRSGAVARE